MPINPNFLERLVLFRLNKGPAPMLDLFGGASFETVAIALEMDLFEVLADAAIPLSTTTLADRTDAHPDGIGMLCDFLETEGYLAGTRDGYRLTGMTKKWLLADSETNMGPWITFWDELVFPFWERELETAITEGEPSRPIYEWFNEEPDRWEIAQNGFRAVASLLVDDVVANVSVPDENCKLIDIGGGHGLYTIELCRRHPNLEATIFDLQGAVEAISDEIPAEVTERIRTRAGDYREDEFGDGYDLALLFNVIHAHDPAENTALFKRVADSLSPNGRLVVLDQWEGSARMPVGRTGLRFVGLTYLTTLGATVYSHDAVTSWLQDAGLTKIKRRGVGPLPGQALIEATKR